MIWKVCQSDVETITAIYNEYVRHSVVTFETELVSEEEMLHRVNFISSEFPYYVYEDGNRVIGYCYAHAWKARAAYVNTLETTIYVSSDCKHKGVGMQLMNRLIADCRKAGYHALIACITDGNEPSIRLHEKLGYEKVSHFKKVGVKFGRMLDVVDYELLLLN